MADLENANETTMPIEATGPLRGGRIRTFAPGDRVTDVLGDATATAPGRRPRRYVGTVIESSETLFRVLWSGGHGVATYTHSAEPGSLRLANASDEHEAALLDHRPAIAAELHRIARRETTWPTEVRKTLTDRAAELTRDVSYGDGR